MQTKARIFGAALDFADDPQRVGLKRAYVEALADGRVDPSWPRDPYDAIAPLVAARRGGSAALAGKVGVPGWLTPRPGPGDLDLIRPEAYRRFMDGNGPAAWIDECGRRAERLRPDTPVMLAVDHALAAGPIAALSRARGAGAMAVVVFDAHFDAVGPEARAGARLGWSGEGLCGDFLGGLIDQGLVLPDRLFVIGVTDYPPPEAAASSYYQEYLGRVREGVKVYPRSEAMAPGFAARLATDLTRCQAGSLYVSLDADAGALACMNAVRYLDAPGLPEAAIMEAARAVRGLVDSGRFELGGVDVCEVDVHLLGLPDPEGRPDRTAEICARFVECLL